ncbi:MAG: hypothetical protein ACPL0A_03105, partial [Candidatus Micrarchaeia archaeon]
MREILLDRRVMFLCAVVLVSLLLIYFKGINYGIEFEGGVRIPITFDRDLSPYQMEEVSNILKTRVSKFGLTQVVVRPLPPRELQIELAKGDESSIQQIEKILRQQGNFEAIIDGKIGITGEDILPGSISDGAITTIGKNQYKWEVDFAVSDEGAKRFAAVAYGKANKPVYMFLDRPTSAIILVEPRHFPKGAGIADVITAVMQFNNIENSNISVIVVDDWNVKKQLIVKEIENSSKIIIASENSTFAEELKQLSNNTRLIPDEDIEFTLSYDEMTGDYIISKWKAIGLLSAPLLSEGLAKGSPSRLVSVSGTAQSIESAETNAKEIRSLLSGGRLPVNAIIGSTISIPAPLGKQFLETSIFGAVVAFILIILFVSVRYANPRLFVPIIVVSLAELIILVAILGGFGTIDFAAMAGIIAAMGVSIDAQIIITDEVFRKGKDEIHASKDELKERENHAFYIITRNVAIAVVAMLPLFFSGVVEIVGFATATILGS